MKREPLELSDITGVQVKCAACGKTESFPFPLDKPEKMLLYAHICPSTEFVHEESWMRTSAGIASAIESMRAGARSSPPPKLKLLLEVRDKV